MGYIALLRGVGLEELGLSEGLAKPCCLRVVKWREEVGVLRGSLQQLSFSTPCGSEFVHGQIELVQGRSCQAARG